MQIERIENMPLEEVDDDGVIRLMSEIISQARSDYNTHLLACNTSGAIIQAESDSRGLLGHIVGYVTGDNQYLLKEVKRKAYEIERRIYKWH